MINAGKLLTASCLAAGLLFSVGSNADAKTFKVAVGDAGGSAQHELGKKFVEVFKAKTGGHRHARLLDPRDQQRDAILADGWCLHLALRYPEPRRRR